MHLIIVAIIIRLITVFVVSLLVFLQLLDQFFGRVEHSVSIGAAGRTPLRLFVGFDGALFTEVVLALGHHRVDKGVLADVALEGEVVIFV